MKVEFAIVYDEPTDEDIAWAEANEDLIDANSRNGLVLEKMVETYRVVDPLGPGLK